MKKNLFGLFALFLAIGFVAFSAFTNISVTNDDRVAQPRYITYDGTDAQNDLANYNSLATAPTNPPATCLQSAKLCWLRVPDTDEDNDVDVDDFEATFDALNVSNPTGNSLDDEAEIGGILEKKQ